MTLTLTLNSHTRSLIRKLKEKIECLGFSVLLEVNVHILCLSVMLTPELQASSFDDRVKVRSIFSVLQNTFINHTFHFVYYFLYSSRLKYYVYSVFYTLNPGFD